MRPLRTILVKSSIQQTDILFLKSKGAQKKPMVTVQELILSLKRTIVDITIPIAYA